MEFIQEFSEGAWGTPLHRLVVIKEDGIRIEGDWVDFGGASIIRDPVTEGHNRSAGWIAFSDQYEGVMPRISGFFEIPNYTERMVPGNAVIPKTSVIQDNLSIGYEADYEADIPHVSTSGLYPVEDTDMKHEDIHDGRPSSSNI